MPAIVKSYDHRSHLEWAPHDNSRAFREGYFMLCLTDGHPSLLPPVHVFRPAAHGACGMWSTKRDETAPVLVGKKSRTARPARHGVAGG